MKAMGIVRRIDDLGRLVIPKEIQRMIFSEVDDIPIELFVNGEKIILIEYRPDKECIFCDERDGRIMIYKERPICQRCIEHINGNIS